MWRRRVLMPVLPVARLVGQLAARCRLIKESCMQLNFTAELAQLMRFTGETATAIRMYSAYSGGSPADYLVRPRDPKREAVELMFLADALHHFTRLGDALETANPVEIVRACDEVLGCFADYDIDRPEYGSRQAKPVFDAWSHTVDLQLARDAMTRIRNKAATSLAPA